MFKRKVISALVLYVLLLPGFAFAQANIYVAPEADINKIKEQGMGESSQVMQTLSYLTDVIGGRLTNSPSMKRANEWTRDTMAKWGMQNAQLVAWGPWGRGWELKKFSAQVSTPQSFPVIAFPKAWSPSTKGEITADVVYFNAEKEEDFAKYKGQLKGKIVLVSGVREIKADFDGMGTRHSPESLLQLANAPDPALMRQRRDNQQQQPQPQMSPQQMEAIQRFINGLRKTNFVLQEGAAVIVDNSSKGSGGTVFVSGANVAQELPADPMELFTRRGNRLSAWDKNAESKMVPQMTMATEDYNRLLRMIQQGVKPQMTVNIQAQYHDEDLMGYNTIAEIPGTDPALKDEIVMMGAHLDSWHGSTGATDNASGSAVAMEAARIILQSGLKPRRTIRVALWSGEEQGLNGSREYVKQVFGEMQGEGQTRGLIKKDGYDKLSAYYNLDNGTGKIRGVYMQGNSAVENIFRQWLMPFREMGATTLTMSNTGGTDHLSFDAIGLPGFQFIQDEIEYSTRTHHSNQDNYDRLQTDDMKQAATIMAAFVYQTAMMDGKIPRKAMN